MPQFLKKNAQTQSHSRYTLPLVAAALGLRHIFSAPAPFGRLYGAEKTSHSGERCMQYTAKDWRIKCRQIKIL